MRRRLALAVSALLLLALAGGTVYVLWMRRAEAERRRRTQDTLDQLVFLLEHPDLGHTTTDIPPPRATGDPRDPTGMVALHEYLMGGHYLLVSDPGTAGSAFLQGELTHDAWGRPIVYRCPGVVHKLGFDFHSFGPDGRDDEGGGDDLVSGVDNLPR